MSNIFLDYSPKEWENFCETMIRHHFGVDHFYSVPDQDEGDCGLEFFITQGSLFQCYLPDPTCDMKSYKTKVQGKINKDLKKLKTYEPEIKEMLGEIIIDRWVLLIPENKSRKLIPYCNKKSKETLKAGISYLNTDNFTVKIETAESYKEAKQYALRVQSKSINIPLSIVSKEEKEAWQLSNSTFSKNIRRKSDRLMGEKSPSFQSKIIENYIKADRFLGTMRTDYPDMHSNIEDTARALLADSETDAVFSEALDLTFAKHIQENNKAGFEKYFGELSDSNYKLLPFGYLSKWVAECDLDFIYDDDDET